MAGIVLDIYSINCVNQKPKPIEWLHNQKGEQDNVIIINFIFAKIDDKFKKEILYKYIFKNDRFDKKY